MRWVCLAAAVSFSVRAPRPKCLPSQGPLHSALRPERVRRHQCIPAMLQARSSSAEAVSYPPPPDLTMNGIMTIRPGVKNPSIETQRHLRTLLELLNARTPRGRNRGTMCSRSNSVFLSLALLPGCLPRAPRRADRRMVVDCSDHPKRPPSACRLRAKPTLLSKFELSTDTTPFHHIRNYLCESLRNPEYLVKLPLLVT